MSPLWIIPATCVASAALLAAYDKAGWGWFLFIAFLTVGAASDAAKG